MASAHPQRADHDVLAEGEPVPENDQPALLIEQAGQQTGQPLGGRCDEAAGTADFDVPEAAWATA